MKSQEIYISVSFRAIIVGLSCAVIECLVAPYNDYVIRGIFLAGGHFPVGPFFVLTVLVLIANTILRRINPEIALSPQELITVWCIMIAAAGIPSSGMMRYCFSPLVAYKYFATPENEWETLFYQYIPHWRVVRDENAIRAFYEGISSGESIPWEVWMIPIAAWTLYVLIIYFVMICLSVLLRRQWVEIEKCTFPLVQLPVEMSGRSSGSSLLNSFFRNRAVWIGFAFPVFIHTLNGFHAFFPVVPSIPMRFWLDPFLIGRPWSALRPFQILVFWSMVGFSYLLTLEVSFSLWFFFLFFKVQCVIGSLLGFRITSSPGVTWTAYSFSAAQEVGACLTIAFFALWKARHHIKNMFKGAFSQKSINDLNEAMPHRLTIPGLIGGIFLLVFLNHLMGMSYGFALIFILFLLGIYIVLTWQVINGGIPFINPSFSPQSFFLTTLGSSRISPSTITSFFMQPRSLTWDLREFMMPNVMNGLKEADEVKVKRQHLLMVMGAAMVLGLLVSYYSTLKVCYKHGALYLAPGYDGQMHLLDSTLNGPRTGTDWTNTGFMIFGSVFTLWLMWMRSIFAWWPIHPIGYTMLSSWASFQLWFSIFLGYIAKYGILKYGGLKVYRQARPVFLGLVLGEMTCAGMWSVVGIITGVSTGYRILPD